MEQIRHRQFGSSGASIVWKTRDVDSLELLRNRYFQTSEMSTILISEASIVWNLWGVDSLNFWGIDNLKLLRRRQIAIQSCRHFGSPKWSTLWNSWQFGTTEASTLWDFWGVDNSNFWDDDSLELRRRCSRLISVKSCCVSGPIKLSGLQRVYAA